MIPGLPGAGEALSLARLLPVCPDPVDLYAALCEGGRRPDTLLLESGTPGTPKGEKSLLVVRSALRLEARGRDVVVEALGPNGASLLPWLASTLRERADLQAAPGRLQLHFAAPPTGSEEERLAAPSPMDVVRALSLGLCSQAQGGAGHAPLVAGTFAYDLLGAFEQLPEPSDDPLGWPDFELWLAEQLIWLHHDRHQTTLVAQVFGGEHAEAAYHDAARAIGRLAAEVEGLPLSVRRGTSGGAAADAGAGPDSDEGAKHACAAGAADPTVDLDDSAYAKLVRRCKEHIVVGDVFQIVPSRTFRAPCSDALAGYRRLRALNPSPYMFFLQGRAGCLLGASPETAVKVYGPERWVEIRPIAGTRPRGLHPDGSLDADLDSRLEAELRLDAKELAEHMMLVDLARNDVARVSEPGTRTVCRLLGVDRYSHVMHLVSHVRGRLRADLDALHAYVASMNMGTLTGAPKIEAARLLRRYEATRRGPYGGAVGYVSGDGSFDTAIVIRSAVVQDGVASVRAGAGVVHDSDPQGEADETRRKAQAVLQALSAAQATLREVQP